MPALPHTGGLLKLLTNARDNFFLHDSLFPPRFFWLISELEALGFSLVAHLALGDAVTRMNSALSLLVNSDSKTTAVVARVSSSKPMLNVAADLITFSTDFEDGSEISTSNSPIVSVFRDVPHRLKLGVPQLKDAYRL